MHVYMASGQLFGIMNIAYIQLQLLLIPVLLFQEKEKVILKHSIIIFMLA